MRHALNVWQELLQSMSQTVTEYHPTVVATPGHPEQLIAGTSFFPGGSGLWRGSETFGPLPEFFPDNPVMFVAHNFDKVSGFAHSLRLGGEASGAFWKTLQRICNEAALPLSSCFFTNALMGLQPTKATGPMPGTALYLAQCDYFFEQQLHIVRPKLLVSLGDTAYSRVRTLHGATPLARLKHPSGLTYVKGELRTSWIKVEAAKLQSALLHLR